MATPLPRSTVSSVATPPHGVPFSEAAKVWARVAALSFGGPAGQIAVMHRIVVEEKRWIGENRFLHALNYCMLLPGPEATQLAIYIGWLMHRTWGGIVAGTLFVSPGVVALMALSWIYAAYGKVGTVEALFFGLKAAVLAIVLEAVARIGRRALKNGLMVAIAALAFIAIFFLDIPFPIIVLGAGVIGFIGGRAGVAAFLTAGGHGAVSGKALADADSLLGEISPPHTRPGTAWSIKVAVLGLVLWLGPVALIAIALGGDSVYAQIGTFFSEMAVVTFGGAYAVLAYVAQAAVEHYHWLAPGEMLDGLGMAETTPGPLIMVLQFVGFMAAFRHAGLSDPMLAGTWGGLLATWVTFVPSFVLIFLGAPYIEALRGNRALSAALAAITAAVVGVILNLAIWFGLHTLFGVVDVHQIAGMKLQVPRLATANLAAMVLTAAAILALFRLKLGMVTVLGSAALAGLAWRALSGAL
jgi:chromate transporter